MLGKKGFEKKTICIIYNKSVKNVFRSCSGLTLTSYSSEKYDRMFERRPYYLTLKEALNEYRYYKNIFKSKDFRYRGF